MIRTALLLTFLILSFDLFAEETLQIYVFEIRPLIYQNEDKSIHGDWYQSFENLSKQSGVKFQYQFMSIPRMEMLLAGKKPGCNLTILKTKERVEKSKINFIYDHPVKTIFKTYQRADDNRKWTLKKLQEDQQLKIITNTSAAINVLKEKNIKAEQLFNLNSIIHMLLMKRVDVVVGSNLAIEKMPEFKKKEVLAGITIKTLSHGIGCSHATPDLIVKKLQKAAKKWSLPH